MHKIIFLIIFLFFLLISSSGLYAQEEEKGGMPPSIVVVSEVSRGLLNPQSEFVGTVYYSEVSDVACEAGGKVETISFKEGHRVKQGGELVSLNSDLLFSDLEKAELDFRRAENLYKEDLISEQLYDERRFELQRLRIEQQKRTVRAPFDGVIIKKHAERGEWLSPGSLVATVANDDLVDIIAEVPELTMRHTKEGMAAAVKADDKDISGKVYALIPSGDVSTRTFPIKIRVKNPGNLLQGMEAVVSLPTGEKTEVLMVERDAVINMFGNNVIFAVIDSKAMMISVQVLGYEGDKAGIIAEGVDEGMQVVIKGNERLRPEQPVTIQK